MENYIQSAVQEGKDVVVSKEFHYNGDSKRPSDIDVCIQTNGIEQTYHYKNETPRAERYNVEDLFKNTEATTNLSKYFTTSEIDYLSEVKNDPQSLTERIDEISNSIPPKAIDSNKDLATIIEPIKDRIDIPLIEAPSDAIQIENIVDSFENIEDLSFEKWTTLSLDEKVFVLQTAEDKIAEIEHRYPCGINIDSLGERCYGYYDPNTKAITINSDYINSSAFTDYKEVLDTLIHEGRHAYQDYNVNERQVHPRNGEIENWKYNEQQTGYLSPEIYGYEFYALQPVESDARAFAADVLDKYLES